SERFAKPNQTSANGTATKDCDRVCRNVRGRRSMNSVTQRFLSACRLNRNSPVVPPRATLVKSMILSKAPVSVDSPQEHPFTDVPIPGPTLKTSSTVNVSLARDNITLSKVRDLLPRLHNLSRKLVTHHSRRLDSLGQ